MTARAAVTLFTLVAFLSILAGAWQVAAFAGFAGGLVAAVCWPDPRWVDARRRNH